MILAPFFIPYFMKGLSLMAAQTQIKAVNPWVNPGAVNQSIHGITFYYYNTGEDITSVIGHTWNTWHLIPTSRPVILPPEPKTLYTDLPGGNGKLDLTPALTGYVTYDNRTGSIEFIVANGYLSWELTYQNILNAIHGRRVFMVLDDDPNWFYQGRVTVNEWKSDKDYSIITLDYDLYPYKREPTSSDEDWLWDPFDFEYGVINEAKSLHFGDAGVEGNIESYTLIGGPEPTPLVLEIESVSDVKKGANFTFEGIAKSAQSVGTHRYPDLIVRNGTNTLTWNGTSTFVATIQYRRGML